VIDDVLIVSPLEGGGADVQITGCAVRLSYPQPIYLPDERQTGSTPFRDSGGLLKFYSTPICFVFKKQFCVSTARSLARAETVIVLAVEASPYSVSAEY
jgi:hypothetical protein